MEYITREEFESLPIDYRMTLKNAIETHKAYWGEDLTEQYENLGYDVDKDYMILASGDNGTMLKPVKIKD
ncbi:MAG: hypothetical protein J6T10_32340 [Methanobrevibacter sp.]|nr:hypothetical protein [Methanobrevibacter sp.]